jgi:hypothetical protein
LRQHIGSARVSLVTVLCYLWGYVVFSQNKHAEPREQYDTLLRAKGITQYKAGYLPLLHRRWLAADPEGLCVLTCGGHRSACVTCTGAANNDRIRP